MAEATKSKKPRLDNDTFISDNSMYESGIFPNEVWYKIFAYLSACDIL